VKRPREREKEIVIKSEKEIEQLHGLLEVSKVVQYLKDREKEEGGSALLLSFIPTSKTPIMR